MSPAAHALDRRIYELRSAREAVVGTIAALQTDGTWSLLAAGLAGESLTGETASRAGPAVARVTELQQGLDLVAQLVDHVVALRDAGPSDERRTTELVALLNSPAILVPTDVPWMEHVLPPPPGDRAVTAQTLLDEMEGALAPVRQVVDEVDAAWQAFLPRLERVSAAADEAAAEAPGNRAITDVRARLTALSDRVVDDPIGALTLLGELEAHLSAAAGLRSEVSRLQSSLADARELLATIEHTIATGAHALGQARAEIASPSGLLDPLDPAAVGGDQGLRPWIVRLERLVAKGDVARASQGLERWNALAASTLSAAEQVAAANSAPPAERSSLLGLLRAARVKAGAAGRAEDLVLAALAESAEQALAVPADLVEAQAHVDAYLEELRRPGVGGPVARPARGSAARAAVSDVDPWGEGVPVGGAPVGGEPASGGAPVGGAPVGGEPASGGAPVGGAPVGGAPASGGAPVGGAPDPWSSVDGGPAPPRSLDAGSPPEPTVDPWAGVAAGAGSAPARRHADLDRRTGGAPAETPSGVTGTDPPPTGVTARGTGAGPGGEPGIAPTTGARVEGPPGGAGGTTSARPPAGSAGTDGEHANGQPGAAPGATTTRPPAGTAGTDGEHADNRPGTHARATTPSPANRPPASTAATAGVHANPPPAADPGAPANPPPASTTDTDGDHTNRPPAAPANPPPASTTGTDGEDADSRPAAPANRPPASTTGTDGPSGEHADSRPGAPANRPPASTADTGGPSGEHADRWPGAGAGAGATTPGTGTGPPAGPAAGDAGPTGATGSTPPDAAQGGGAGASGGTGRWERPAEPPRRGPDDEAGTDVWKEMSA